MFLKMEISLTYETEISLTYETEIYYIIASWLNQSRIIDA